MATRKTPPSPHASEPRPIKQPLTIRIDPAFLAEARRCAVREHRTLTNFIEAVLRERIALGPDRDASTGPWSKTREGQLSRDA